MKIKYKIPVPSTGLYLEADTLEEANLIAREAAWEFYKQQTAPQPISKVLITDEGAEIWGSSE